MTQSAHQQALKAAAPIESQHAPIDMEHLLHYTMGDEKLAREVLSLFSSQGRVYLQQLSEASAPKERKIAAHTLKGSAKGVGALQVAGTAEALEGLAGSPDDAAWTLALGELKAAFADADRFINDLG